MPAFAQHIDELAAEDLRERCRALLDLPNGCDPKDAGEKLWMSMPGQARASSMIVETAMLILCRTQNLAGRHDLPARQRFCGYTDAALKLLLLLQHLKTARLSRSRSDPTFWLKLTKSWLLYDAGPANGHANTQPHSLMQLSTDSSRRPASPFMDFSDMSQVLDRETRSRRGTDTQGGTPPHRRNLSWASALDDGSRCAETQSCTCSTWACQDRSAGVSCTHPCCLCCRSSLAPSLMLKLMEFSMK